MKSCAHALIRLACGGLLEFRQASTGACSPADQQSYSLLAVFPEDAWVPVPALALYLGVEEAEVEAYVGRMLARRLLQRQVRLLQAAACHLSCRRGRRGSGAWLEG